MLNIILSIVFALSGATLLFFSGIILRENPRGRINRITALMLFFAGIAPVLATVYYALIIPSGKELPVWLFNLFFTWELFFPSLVMFSVVFPAEHIYYKSHRRLFFAAFIPHIAHIVMVTGFSDPNAILSAISFESDFPILGILFEYIGYFLKLIVVLFGLALEVHNRFFSIVNLTYLLASTFFLYQGYKTVINPRIKQQVRIIIYGITTAVGLYAFAYIIPSIFAIRILPQLQYLMIIIGLLVGPGLIAWAILKYRFLDIRLIVRQSLVYSLSSVVVIGGYLIIINSLGNFLRNVFGAGFAVLEVAVILLALLFFQPVLNFLDSLLRRLFIKGGTDFRDVLERFSSTIITLFDFDKLVSEILKTFKDDLLIENVFLCLPGEKGQCKVIPADTEKSFFVRKDRVLESFLIVKELPVPAVDVPVPALAQASRDLFKDKETRILIPLISSHRLLGYIGIGEKTSGLGYNTEDIMTFKVLANQTVVAINNARLYKESMENQRREEELAIARQIQRQLLPKQMPSSDKLQFSAYSESSREVGGDYYDFINISDTRLAFAIGDASGKGVPASLLIARMQAILHSVAVSELDINSKIHHINNVLSVSGMPERFITFFYGEIDIDKMTLQYCNAGHNYPLLLHQNGDYDMLQEGGLLLGAFADAPYQSGSKKLDSGDLLMCYTDGVTEAMDYNDVEFGEEKLTNLLISKNDVPLKSLEETILDNIRMHCGDRPLQDDATMLMMKVL